MGCSTSRLEDEEAVQLCKDRRNFIKQAVEQRLRFVSGHIAYIQSLKRVSHALRDFVDGDEHHDSFSDTFTTPPFTPMKKLSPEMIGVPFKSSVSALNQSDKSIGIPLKSSESTINHSKGSTFHIARYMQSGGSSSISVEECPQPAETVRINSYYSMDHYGGGDGFFATQASPLSSSYFSSAYDRPSYTPASPQNQQWDSFWNPFSSLDTYGYSYQNTFDQMINDDDVAGLRQVREEEGIPELEEEGSREEDEPAQLESQHERCEANANHTRTSDASLDSSGAKSKGSKIHGVKEFQKKQHMDNIEVSETKDAIELKITKEKEVVSKRKSAEETPGFTVYLNRRPATMVEIMKDIEGQFMRICDCAHEVSVLLEANRAQHLSTSTELAVKMMNPVALFRSGSSRSSSSRFFHGPSSSGCDGYESSSDYSEESCMISGSHQSTLDRLYEWEKKLYEEVKAGERIRIAFEKRYMQMRSQDVHGEELSVGKTRAVVRDLHTRLKVSIHSVESVSKRIETLRDEELHPQLIELLQGLAKMWRTTAECHRIQKRTIDEAKLLILSSAATGKAPENSPPARHPRLAIALETELRNWRACLEAWVAAQRAYARALAGWALRCSDPGGGGARSPLSPPRSSAGAPPVMGVCAQWSRLLESVGEAQVVDGLDFFAAGIGSVSGMATAEEEGEGEDGGGAAAAAVATAEMARRVLCAGMSVAVSSLAEFAARSAEGYEILLVRRGGERRAES
ncbi:hypothetical protein Cni_G17298 [Canna indica]|uniref:Uncharacterized protein n=1 Tax=Canna indica TaxID=4628 RepID=A0AAQ3KGP9_9LILI|nr:hypothetical protein Cni_G17298 [Canna indica]